MRKTPRILSLHVSMAASYWQSQFESGAKNASDIQLEFQNMLRGIQMYMAHPYQRTEDHLELVLEKGASRILRLKEHDYNERNPVALLIPSLINKAHIFDVTEQQSMLRYFCDNGVDAYLLDWGGFLLDHDMQNVSDVVLKRLHFLSQGLSRDVGRNIHAIGYCMGGSLLAGYLACRMNEFNSATFMATPWDFHAGSQEMLNRVKFWSPSLMSSMQQDGEMKVDWLQILFSSLYPEQAMKKFSKFSKMDLASKDAEIFVAVEDWLNDGVPLPAGIGREATQDWFLRNVLCLGQWRLNDKEIDPNKIDVPCFVVASSKDKLVEYDSAMALRKQLKNVMHHDPECGHVGMIAGARAVENVWRPIIQFIFSHDG